MEKKSVKKQLQVTSNDDNNIDEMVKQIKIETGLENINVIEVNGLVAYLKNPDRYTVGRALNFLKDQENPELIKAGEVILKECILNKYSSREFLTDDKLILSAAFQCVTLIDVYEATIKKK